jgi:uncharacterized protein
MATTEVKDVYAGAGWIRTQYGKFDLENPTFDIWDIGYALGMNCRYNGHTDGFYSVAEHCVKVSRLMELLGTGDPKEGLLHDATEAYLTDIPAPFKQFLPDWKAIDARVDAAMRTHFQLEPMSLACKSADWILLFIEAEHLIPGKGADFTDPRHLRSLALSLGQRYPELGPGCWEPRIATEQYMARAMQYGLCGNVRA